MRRPSSPPCIHDMFGYGVLTMSNVVPFKAMLVRQVRARTAQLAPEERRALLVALRKHGQLKAEDVRQRTLQSDKGELF